MTQRAPLLNWSPHPLIAHVAAATLDGFCADFKSALFLIVRLDDFSSELADGLNASKPSTPQIRPRRQATISVVAPDELTQVTPLSTPSMPTSSRPPVRASDEFSSVPDLLYSACHVIEIKKHKHAPPIGMVSVGRASDHDIVLQHPSVSRTHAHFDYGDGLFLKDAGSSNRTFVNGDVSVGRVPVAAGDVIKFGAVRCSVCSPAGLWRAIHR